MDGGALVSLKLRDLFQKAILVVKISSQSQFGSLIGLEFQFW